MLSTAWNSDSRPVIYCVVDTNIPSNGIHVYLYTVWLILVNLSLGVRLDLYTAWLIEYTCPVHWPHRPIYCVLDTSVPVKWCLHRTMIYCVVDTSVFVPLCLCTHIVLSDGDLYIVWFMLVYLFHGVCVDL